MNKKNRKYQDTNGHQLLQPYNVAYSREIYTSNNYKINFY